MERPMFCVIRQVAAGAYAIFPTQHTEGSRNVLVTEIKFSPVLRVPAMREAIREFALRQYHKFDDSAWDKTGKLFLRGPGRTPPKLRYFLGQLVSHVRDAIKKQDGGSELLRQADRLTQRDKRRRRYNRAKEFRPSLEP